MGQRGRAPPEMPINLLPLGIAMAGQVIGGNGIGDPLETEDLHQPAIEARGIALPEDWLEPGGEDPAVGIGQAAAGCPQG